MNDYDRKKIKKIEKQVKDKGHKTLSAWSVQWLLNQVNDYFCELEEEAVNELEIKLGDTVYVFFDSSNRIWKGRIIIIHERWGYGKYYSIEFEDGEIKEMENNEFTKDLEVAKIKAEEHFTKLINTTILPEMSDKKKRCSKCKK